MALKLGNRVTVKPNPSNCTDEGSVQWSRRMKGDDSGIPRTHFAGRVGEVVQIGAKERLDIKDGQGRSLGEALATCPPGCENSYLVDSQVVSGKRVGACDHREWYREEELELG
jgi:hypothetical protein